MLSGHRPLVRYILVLWEKTSLSCNYIQVSLNTLVTVCGLFIGSKKIIDRYCLEYENMIWSKINISPFNLSLYIFNIKVRSSNTIYTTKIKFRECEVIETKCFNKSYLKFFKLKWWHWNTFVSNFTTTFWYFDTTTSFEN